MAEESNYQPAASVVEASAPSTNPTEDLTTSAPTDSSAWGRIKWVGHKIFLGMEYIGEAVAGVLGLDESRFQYVIDGMNAEDWQAAVDRENQRRAEENITEEVSIKSLTEDGLIPEYVVDRMEEQATYAAVDAHEGQMDAVERMERGQYDEVELVPTNDDLTAASAISPKNTPSMTATPEAAPVDVGSVKLGDI